MVVRPLNVWRIRLRALVLLGWGIALQATEIVFPDDLKAMLDVERDLGAKGDGQTDLR